MSAQTVLQVPVIPNGYSKSGKYLMISDATNGIAVDQVTKRITFEDFTAGLMHAIGNETFDGVKTFLSGIVLPNLFSGAANSIRPLTIHTDGTIDANTLFARSVNGIAPDPDTGDVLLNAGSVTPPSLTDVYAQSLGNPPFTLQITNQPFSGPKEWWTQFEGFDSSNAYQRTKIEQSHYQIILSNSSNDLSHLSGIELYKDFCIMHLGYQDGSGLHDQQISMTLDSLLLKSYNNRYNIQGIIYNMPTTPPTATGQVLKCTAINGSVYTLSWG